LAEVLAGDHFEAFYESFQPIDDDLLSHIEKYKKINFPAGKDKHSRDILKIIDDL
jgi:iron-sulfur cluster repair protein YtfE (RIC family)